MRVAAIGRTEILYNTIELMVEQGHEIGLIVTTKETPEYTKTSEDFKQLAEKLGAKFIHTGRIKTILDPLKDMEPMDVAVSVNYSGIIPSEVINAFPLGILNAHGGDLPKYRGNACQAWAIINGEKRVGLCIHGMIGGELDNGDIISRDFYPLDDTTKVGEIWNWMEGAVPVLFAKAVDELSKDPKFVLEVQSTNPNDALRCYPRKPEDGKINWKLSNLEILRLINASGKPYAGAFCDYEGSTLIIWDAELLDTDSPYLAVPGQVLNIEENHIDIATGIGKIRIKEIEYDGDIMAPNALIKSIRKRLS